jgi:hypothetical protein
MTDVAWQELARPDMDGAVSKRQSGRSCHRQQTDTDFLMFLPATGG